MQTIKEAILYIVAGKKKKENINHMQMPRGPPRLPHSARAAQKKRKETFDNRSATLSKKDSSR